MKKLTFILTILGMLFLASLTLLADATIVTEKDKTSLNNDLPINVCGFEISDLKGWKKVSLQIQADSKVNLSVTKDQVFAVIMCIDKYVTMDQWIDGTRVNLNKQFEEYELTSEKDMQFHNKDAHRFDYKAKSYGNPNKVIGSLIITDLDKKGLIISIAAPAVGFDDRKYLFDEVMGLIKKK